MVVNPFWPPRGGQANPNAVAGFSAVMQPALAALQRPNDGTAYAPGQAIGSATAAVFQFSGLFLRPGSSGIVTELRLVSTAAGIVPANMGQVLAHLYVAPPAAAVATGLVDQAPFPTLFADDVYKLGIMVFSNYYQGSTSGGTPSDMIESEAAPLSSQRHVISAAPDASLYAVLMANAQWTPLANQITQLYVSAVLDS